MGKFDAHFRMMPADAMEYAREKLDYFNAGADLECAEVGNGNINYVFRVRDKNTGKSLIIKHGTDAIRSNPNRHLGTDRGRIEAELLVFENEKAPGMVPEVYRYDSVMNCLCMEDLSDYAIMREALCRHEIVPDFAENITTFIVNTLLPTTDMVMIPGEKKRNVAKYINPELCKITEELVFTDPFFDPEGRNELEGASLVFAREHIYADDELARRGARLKNAFMNNAQALIHGDLHTGSIFVRGSAIKVIDPEFACYAPMGYDLGNVVGNLVLAWGHALGMMSAGAAQSAYLRWLEGTISDIVDIFAAKFMEAWAAQATDPVAKAPGFSADYLRDVLDYSAGIAGCEVLRRVMGNAKVIDTTTISPPERRAEIERVLMLCGRDFILNSENLLQGEGYLRILREHGIG